MIFQNMVIRSTTNAKLINVFVTKLEYSNVTIALKKKWAGMQLFTVYIINKQPSQHLAKRLYFTIFIKKTKLLPNVSIKAEIKSECFLFTF